MVDNFKDFFFAKTATETFTVFHKLCNEAAVQYPPEKNENYDHCTFYQRLTSGMRSSFWKTRQFLDCINIRYNRDEYFYDDEKLERVAKDKCAFIVGAGPCGLRAAIELTLLGAKTVVVEKRDSFTRNNVLHLWPFNVADLKTLGAKLLHPKLGTGGIDHIAIRRIQLILLKTALLLGVEIHLNAAYTCLIPPSSDNDNDGWKASVEPEIPSISNFTFDMILCANARRDTLPEFSHKCFRGKLAIGITANFINRNTSAEAKIQETGGLACYGKPSFFADIYNQTQISLENFVYFKDETHYFVMTATKDSLLKREVLKDNLKDTRELLSRDNVSFDKMSTMMNEIVNFATDNKIPNLQLCNNHKGEPDMASFDFTAMYQARHSTLFKESHGHKLLLGLVGDSLLEPFWPMGTGCARGFFAAFDHVWMMKQWCVRTRRVDDYTGNTIEIRLLKEREATYKLLSQINQGNTCKPVENYSIDPDTRYPFVNMDALKLRDIEHLYIKCD